MKRSNETWLHLLHRSLDQASAERLAEQVLLDQGFTAPAPTRARSRSPGGVDRALIKDGQRWIPQVYFLHEQQKSFVVIKKFISMLGELDKNTATGIVFITNQELSLTTRNKMKALANANSLEIFHLERLADILDQPHMAMAREQLALSLKTKEEQSAN